MTDAAMPSMLPFTEEDFAGPWEQCRRAAARAARGEGRGGLQRDLLLHPRRRAADRGVPGRRRASGSPRPSGSRTPPASPGPSPSCWSTAGPRSTCTAATCTASRSSSSPTDYVSGDLAAELRRDLRHRAPAAAAAVAARPAGQPVPRAPAGARRGLPRGRRLGAPALVRGERRRWSPTCRAEWTPPARDAWSAQFHSPIAAVEAWRTRDGVAMYDMTPLKRLEVSRPRRAGPARPADHREDGQAVGAVTYTLALDEAGGIRSDLTVARLGPRPVPGRRERSTGPRPPAAGRLPSDGSVQVRDITGGTCCIGVWGPLARELVQPLSRRRLLATRA